MLINVRIFFAYGMAGDGLEEVIAGVEAVKVVWQHPQKVSATFIKKNPLKRVEN